MKTRKLVEAAVVGAVYTVLTLVLAPISFGGLQFRVSEALTVLPFFMPHTAWGLAIGCAISNIFGGYGIMDIVLGSLATLAAGLITSRIRIKALAPLPPVLFNAVVVGFTIAFATSFGSESFFGVWAMNMASVGAGELGACYALGLPLIYLLRRIPYFERRMVEQEKPEKLHIS